MALQRRGFIHVIAWTVSAGTVVTQVTCGRAATNKQPILVQDVILKHVE